MQREQAAMAWQVENAKNLVAAGWRGQSARISVYIIRAKELTDQIAELESQHSRIMREMRDELDGLNAKVDAWVNERHAGPVD